MNMKTKTLGYQSPVYALYNQCYRLTTAETNCHLGCHFTVQAVNLACSAQPLPLTAVIPTILIHIDLSKTISPSNFQCGTCSESGGVVPLHAGHSVSDVSLGS